MAKKRIILAQVGSPKTSKVSDVRSYLREFLSDPRVIDLPKKYWNIILYLFILPFRPKRSAKAYKRIEFCGFFPLVEVTRGLARKMQSILGENYTVEAAFLLSDKRLKTALVEASANNEEIWVLPQFPQYSTTTTACVTDQIEAVGLTDEVNLIPSYHRLRAFIDLAAQNIEAHMAKYPADVLVISFHGIPVRYVTEKKDIYYQHCWETFLLLKQKLSLPDEKIHMSFQSRLGSEQWLGPYTDQYVLNLVETKTANSIAVYCPSFVADCLETIDEIGIELGHEIKEAGGEIVFVPCLNNGEQWSQAYTEFVVAHINRDQEKIDQLTYKMDEQEVIKTLPKQGTGQTKMDDKAKKTVKIMFLTLFLDLIGFSIIFPMFPALAKHYLEVDSENYFLKMLFGSISSLTNLAGTDMSAIVLFGGALGALYSLLQFFAAPIWGGLSDRYGRKPILMISIFGLFSSYLLWIFSGSFTTLILARLIGGIMGGNLSTATAAVADVTDDTNRSKGMAFVGIAFALGFIFGPAIGGILTLVNPLEHFPGLAVYGLNPFSYAAGFAAILSLINLIFLMTKFEETLPKNKKLDNFKTANILKLFKPLPYPAVNRTNISYFLFISAFSGMEFTLTFLAVERLAYTSMDNAYMFIFIGFIIAFVQGGYVRRKAHEVGEKKMAIQGLIAVIPGLVIIAFNHSSVMLYLGLFFLALGSAMAIPTLTSLVSIHTPKDEQGRSLGIFRSLGSLGRVIGPIIASLLYWKFGASIPYLLGAAFILIPAFILSKLSDR